MKNYKLLLFFFLFCCFIAVMSCSKPKEYCSFSATNNSGTSIKLLTSTNAVYATIPNDNKKYTIDGPLYGGSTLKSIGVFTPRLISPVKIVFNDMDTVYHYNDEEIHTGKYLNKNQSRSLFNSTSYKIEKANAGENGIYSFTKEDWDFAKQP